MKIELDHTPSATPGMTAFARLETVDGQPLVTTAGLFIADSFFEELGRPSRIAITMESVR